MNKYESCHLKTAKDRQYAIFKVKCGKRTIEKIVLIEVTLCLECFEIIDSKIFNYVAPPLAKA